MSLNAHKLTAFWAPLEATWLMMALEGPLVAALIARLDSPKVNLAAYGVALAFAMLMEAPIIMVMSAATALAVDRDSYRRLRNFTFAINVIISATMAVALLPGVFDRLVGTLALPPEVALRTRVACALFLPWPAAIGYRRLYQGILIRVGLTRRVAYGTVIRLSTMGLALVGLGWWSGLEGASVGAASLAMGVVAEAVGSRLMARRQVRALAEEPTATTGNRLSYRDIFTFYYPLALTSLLNMGILPVVTFFIARGRMPLESLAVLPVVNSLLFLFRTVGLAGQEVVIALLAQGRENLPVLRRFMAWLAGLGSGGFALIACTPLAEAWFEGISGLSPPLAQLAVLPSQVLVVMPAATAWMCWQRAVLVSQRATGSTWAATATEVVGVILVMILGNALGWVGIVTAACALVAGRVCGNTVLVIPVRRAVANLSKPVAMLERLPDGSG